MYEQIGNCNKEIEAIKEEPNGGTRTEKYNICNKHQFKGLQSILKYIE